MRKSVLFASALLAVLLLSAIPAYAYMITITLSGTIRALYYTPFNPSVQVGTTYTAIFQINSDASFSSGSTPYDPQFFYQENGVSNGMTLRFGNYDVQPTGNTHNELKGMIDGLIKSTPCCDTPADNLYLRSWSGEGSGLRDAYSLVKLYSPPRQSLTSPGLPPLGPGMNDITTWTMSTESYFQAMDDSGNRYIWDGDVSAIDTTSIPEPSTLLLFGTGLGGCALAAWRKRNRHS